MSNMVDGVKVTIEDLCQMACKSRRFLWDKAAALGREPAIYLHWTAGHYGQFYDGYHINIDADGSVYVTVDSLDEILSHTWHRNTGAIGIALACCAFCDTNDLGAEPPTDLQIEAMAQVVAMLAAKLNIPVDIDHVMTHAEAADCLDNPENPQHELYGPDNGCERWDLWFFPGVEKGKGGEVLRGKAQFYREELLRITNN